MIDKTLQAAVDKIDQLLQARRIHDAFVALRALAARLGSWEVTGRIDQIEESYTMMLSYARQGALDPERDRLLESIINGIYTQATLIVRALEERENPTSYFGALRYEGMQPSESVSRMLERYGEMLGDTSLFNVITSTAEPHDRIRALESREALERRLFNKLWVTFPLSHDDADALRQAWLSPALPDYFKSMLVSAVMLGLTAYYDDNRVILLLDLYSGGSRTLALQALCALLLGVASHPGRTMSPDARRRISVLRDTTSWSDDLRMVVLQLVRTRDTERINRTMQEDLLPRLMKLRPDITHRFRNLEEISDPLELEENPEWQEILDKSGITEKLRELSELQEQGDDVFMSTFSHLKSFPFFSDVSNWFMPFHLDNSTVRRAMGDDSSMIGELIGSSPFLCDSDKFSFVLAVSSVPDEQRKMMMSQFDKMNINAAQLAGASLTTAVTDAENIVKNYVQDLFRFFKLYRRKSEFVNPFDLQEPIARMKIFAPDLMNGDTLSLLGEFYMKRGYYVEAVGLFKLMLDVAEPSAQLYQKLGYCEQKSGNLDAALDYYTHAELLNPDDRWTKRHLAAVNKALGRYESALAYFKQIEATRTDDLTTALNIGHCLLELNRPAEALKYYYKVEYLDQKSTRALRPLAWALLLSGDLAQSARYYERILALPAKSVDYLNMGHLQLVSGNVQEAVNYYNLFIDTDDTGADTERFIEAFNEDSVHLLRLQVDKTLLPLVIDAVLYSRR